MLSRVAAKGRLSLYEDRSAASNLCRLSISASNRIIEMRSCQTIRSRLGFVAIPSYLEYVSAELTFIDGPVALQETIQKLSVPCRLSCFEGGLGGVHTK